MEIRISFFSTSLTNPYFISTLFGGVSSEDFQALMMKELSFKYGNKQLTTRDNGNFNLMTKKKVN